MKHKKGINRQNTNTEGATGSNGNSHSKTRRSIKIVSFSINNITGYNYSMQLIIKMIKRMKNLMIKFLRLKKLE